MNFRAKGLMASLVLGMGLIASLLAGSALAQRPEGERQPPVRRVEANAGWLILDPAKPVDEVLPPLLKALAGLEARGEIIDFDQTPRSRAPTAVPGLRVIARPGALNTLRGLPGVLDVSDRLPPPPPVPGEISAMGATGTITGRVTEAGTGIPLSWASVDIYDAVSYMSLGWANTDIDGYYTATVTTPFSRIKIRFGEWGWPSFYAPEWYDDKDYFSSADAIILPAGGTIPNVNAALGKLGAINGTVTFDESGLPVEGASVSAHSSDGATNWYWHDTTDGTGHYEFSVPAGIYKLRFAGGPISEEWYQDEVSQSTAYSVTVVTGQTEIINASVAPAGQIAGTVTDEATGLPTGAVITVYDLSDKVVGYTWTDNDGLYQVGGLDTGSYKVRFRKNDYYEEYYDNQPNRGQANLVSVTAGATTSNINAALTPLPSVITGTVTKDGGDPLEWDEYVYVGLYDAASGDWEGDYSIAGDGITTDYTFPVSPGTYHALFDSLNPGFGIEWYNDKTSQANADLVTVAYGQTKTDVSADLTTATGCITGVLTAADNGSRIPDANVEVFYTEDGW
jgi:5-hydroxyisourate hydrolase-like protein (transthyretin family)